MIEIDKIYNEDCLTGMQRIPDGSVDAIICDLPYEVLNDGNPGAQWDKMIPLEPLWEQYLRVTKQNAAIVLFAQGMFTAQLMMSQPKIWRYNLVWDKMRATGFLNCNRAFLRQHEDLCVFYRQQPTFNPQKYSVPDWAKTHPRGKGASNTNNCYGKFNLHLDFDITNEKYPRSIISFSKRKGIKHEVHPTQKPVDLLRYLIRTFTNEGDLVLDNTCGSGTTCVAAVKEKRHFLGFELNKEYFDIAQRRIRQEQAQPSLF